MTLLTNEAPGIAISTFTSAHGFPLRSYLGCVLAERSIGATSIDFTVNSCPLTSKAAINRDNMITIRFFIG